MVLIIQSGENVNHAGFNDTKNNLLDNGCHHQKGRECECMCMEVLTMSRQKQHKFYFKSKSRPRKQRSRRKLSLSLFLLKESLSDSKGLTSQQFLN